MTKLKRPFPSKKAKRRWLYEQRQALRLKKILEEEAIRNAKTIEDAAKAMGISLQ